MEEIKATDCIIKVHHKWQYKVTFFCIKISCIQPKARDNLCSPLRRAYLLLLPSTLCKSHGDLHLSFLHFILWQAQDVGKDPNRYI